MKKLVLLAWLGVFGLNLAVDAFDSDCLRPAATAPCCPTCSCRLHALPPIVPISLVAVDAPSQFFPAIPRQPSRILLDKSLFQPPRLA